MKIEHEPEISPNGTAERLQKVLAHAGVGSRRACERLITEGRVTVNNRIVSQLGTKVNPEVDEIRVDGRLVRIARRHTYLMLHKPSGFVTTVHDPQGRPTVMDLITSEDRLYPVGRLDVNTEGLLIITNDGALANRIMHPRYQLEKEYLVEVTGPLDAARLEQLRSGVRLEDGMTRPAQVEMVRSEGHATWLRMVIHEGRNRQVRRMLAAVGCRVERLIRTRVGPITLGDLPVGQSRPLTPREVRALMEQLS